MKADPLPLLSLLAGATTDKMLRTIAQQDYGDANDLDRHLEELRRMRAGQYFVDPRTHYWYPLEVIELMRWAEPERDTYPSGKSKHELHGARAFCCAIILYIADSHPDPEYCYASDGHDTLIQLLDSLESLGTPFLEAALSFLAWRLANGRCFESQPYFLLAALYLRLKLGDAEPEQTETLAHDILAAEQDIRSRIRRDVAPGWLLPLTGFDIKHDAWRALFGRLSALIAGLTPDMMSPLYELQVCLDA